MENIKRAWNNGHGGACIYFREAKTEVSQQTRIEKVGSKKWIPDEWPNVIYMAFEHKRFQTYVVAYIEVKLAVR